MVLAFRTEDTVETSDAGTGASKAANILRLRQDPKLMLQQKYNILVPGSSKYDETKLSLNRYSFARYHYSCHKRQEGGKWQKRNET